MTNILKPELIWVDGRCYRFLENSEGRSSHNISPYIEDKEIDHTDYDEEFSNSEIEIVPQGATRFKHTFHVAKSFFPFIVGSKNAVRKRLETENRTIIQVPKPGEDGDIVIIGHNHKGIMTTRRRIDLIIESTRKRLQVTHFLSIPLNEPNIMVEFNTFKKDVISNLAKRSRAVNEKIFQTPSKLHLTIGVLTLLDDTERSQAIEALNYCKEHIVKQIIKKYGQPHIRLQGTEIMNDDPSEVRVLYAKIIPNKALQEIVDEIVNYYADIGLIQKEKEFVKLHATLMQTKFALNDEEIKDRVFKTFDATEILKIHGNTFFGETTLKEIHISQRHTVGNDGYYQATAKIILSEDL